MAHILLTRIVSFVKEEMKAPDGFNYLSSEGMWVANNNQYEVLVKSPGPGRPPMGTKKCDVETGEDQKGK
jgi:hypothetical protein